MMEVIGRTPEGSFIVIMALSEIINMGKGNFSQPFDLNLAAESLKRRRKELGISQTEMAKTLGMSRNSLSQIENGHRVNISAKFRDAIVEVINEGQS